MALDQFINRGIDDRERLILKPITKSTDKETFVEKKEVKNRFFVEEQENLEWDEIFVELLRENSPSHNGFQAKLKKVCCQKLDKNTKWYKKIFRFLCCFSWCSRFRKSSYYTNKEKAKQLIMMR